MPKILSLSLLLVFLLGVSPHLTHAQDDLPTRQLKPTACRFDAPVWQRVNCYDLIVPEDRANAESPNLRLHVAVFRSANPNATGDPIVYLEGGPGFSALATVPYAFDFIYEPFLRSHDLVIMDQRGTGYSQPNLHCYELAWESNIQSVFDCWNRFKEEGIHMTSYNSAENAADFDDLRRALGYDQWNLYGGSYGTRLGLTILRDYPQGVRTAILDGVYPPNVNIYTEFPLNVDRAFQTLFTACATDQACNTAYPNLRDAFKQQIETLSSSPAEVALDDNHLDIPLTAFDFVSIIFGSLYDESIIPLLPSMIYEANLGNYEPLLRLMGGRGLQQNDFDPLSLSHGMYYALQCTEEASFTTLEEWQSQADQFPYLKPYLDENFVFGYPAMVVCDRLDLDIFDQHENDPVVSDIPVLIFSGQFDPITPPRWGKIASQSLENSFHYTFPAMGHVVFMADQCPQYIAEQFWADPAATPDSSCIDSMPLANFVLP